MYFDKPALDVTEVGSTNRKCPPSMDRAADTAALFRCSDELEYQDRGGNELAGCRYGLEIHPRRHSGKVESLQARAPTNAHKCRCRDRADTWLQPQSQWQTDKEVTKPDRSPEGATLLYFLDLESFLTWFCVPFISL